MDDSHSSTKQPPFPFMDSHHKSTKFHPFSFSPSPHMLAFHLGWLSLFSCFFSTFSIPPLIPVIRNDLNLTPTHISNAGIASFLGSIFSRLAMGPICDLFGPRIATATFSLATVPVILSMCLVTTPTSFIIIRFLVGFCLANFVANQYWMASMFSPCVVGAATSVSAGWAAMGSGFSQLVMPEIYSLICSTNISSNSAWRAAFLVPAIFQAITAILVMVYSQDHPTHQNNKDWKKADDKPEESLLAVLFNGLTNYRGWVLGLAYGFSFGSELTTNNVIAQYFYDRFGVNLQVAGMIAASFGLANGFSRPTGGLLSDKLGRRFGVRGRLWGLWVVQTLAGLLCVLLGRVNSLWSSIAVMCIFSVFLQAASGLTFGVVPFVSKRSLGVISGMTGSGGTVGAVVTQLLLFSGSRYSKQTSISLMGVMMVICTLPVTSIYFPQWGGMLCSPSKENSEEEGEDYHLAFSINSLVPKHRCSL